MGKAKSEKNGNPKKIQQTEPQGAALPLVPEGADKVMTSDKAPKIRICGTQNPKLQNLFLSQSLTAYGSKDTGKKSALENLKYVLPAITGIDPKNELEGMLAVQMVGVHNVAMNCLGRAQLEEQTFEGRGANLKYATRLLQIFTAQMEAFQRCRGKSTQQKVTVEHVHVHQGGQAIVGTVNAQGKGGGGGDEGQE